MSWAQVVCTTATIVLGLGIGAILTRETNGDSDFVKNWREERKKLIELEKIINMNLNHTEDVEDTRSADELKIILGQILDIEDEIGRAHV